MGYESKSVNVCPLLNIANKEETRCLKSRCSFWCKSTETTNPVRKCAVVVIAEKLANEK